MIYLAESSGSANYLPKGTPDTVFAELRARKAIFQPDIYGGFSFSWPSGPSDLAVVKIIEQEVLKSINDRNSGSSEISQEN